jgi:trehalose/maltose hydrolase-like predicted phosphorylase
VGWWKMAIRYFAKVLNAPNWIGIDIEINGESGLKHLYIHSRENFDNLNTRG